MTLALRASADSGPRTERRRFGDAPPAAFALPRRLEAQRAFDGGPDLLGRARALWPRLSPPHDPMVRRDPQRMAVHVSRRTSLPLDAIRVLLELA